MTDRGAVGICRARHGYTTGLAANPSDVTRSRKKHRPEATVVCCATLGSDVNTKHGAVVGDVFVGASVGCGTEVMKILPLAICWITS